MDKKLGGKLLPFVLTIGIIALDQLTKWIVGVTIDPGVVGVPVIGDLVRLIHVYNPGIAFSIGGNLSANIRAVLFGLIPLFIIIIVIFVYFRSDELNRFQRWCVTGIIGGGLGNLLDRFFRPDGVLDFIDVKFFGLFGFDRFPTFNVADSSVVVCGILLMTTLLFGMKTTKETGNE